MNGLVRISFCANDAGESMFVHVFGKKKIG
jgi:hypothetical protein